jgi:hypothetical protein
MYDAELGFDEAEQANCGSYSSNGSYRPRDHADANVESLTYSVFDADWNQTREDVAHSCIAQAQHSKQTGQYMNPKLKHVDKPICPKSLQAAQDVIMAMLTTIAVSSLRLLKSTTNLITHTIRVKPGTPPLKQKERRIPLKYA